MVEPEQEHVQDLYKDLTNSILQGKSPEAARSELKLAQERLFRNHPAIIEVRLVALEAAYGRYREAQNQVQYLQKRALRFGREQWYLGPAEDGSLWDRLVARQKLEGRNDEEIQLLDTDSSIVVGLLDSPSKETFSTRGLVVGHVQSGKTANMAAVITKAADTPYKFFLVLSGITDQLRNQTQVRLQGDVVDLAPERWMTWTAANTERSNGDFSEKAVGGFSFDHRNQLAIVKKNPAVLRRILAKLKNTDEATLKHTRFLIIDDECDQASVNSARYHSAVTKINGLIRQILARLPRVAYVGYSATPFANVLIDTTVPEDLYPRHFIHALKRPKSYFGAQELFGRHALEGEYDDIADGYEMIRLVPEKEIDLLRPSNKSDEVRIANSLKQAIRYFVLVVAARRARGQSAKNNSMLVHTSVLNSVHRKTEAVVTPYVTELAHSLGKANKKVLGELEKEWVAEQEKVLSEQFDREPVSFAQLLPFLASAAGGVKVHVENWTAVDRLDYSGGPHTYLVIGGNVLARGLTLQGLSVSFFLRSSSQYDTLMQMGRWFGYREGFEDLPRVWVEERVRDAFFDLATVEAEMRRDIARYAEEELTPSEFAVRIRKIPGMTITAPAKMRSAVAVEVGYSGTHVQTFRFKRKEAAWLRLNWDAGARLIDAISTGTNVGEGRVFRNVPAELVIRFLLETKVHETHKNLSPEFLPPFIRKAAITNYRLKEWSVVVVSGGGELSMEPLGNIGRIATVIRSAEADSGDDASIKALMTRRDILLDLDDRPTFSDALSWDELKELREQRTASPLLLLYPIEARSTPRPSKAGSKNSREPLNAKCDVLGFGIVFPGSRELSGTYVAANITPDVSEPADELGDEDRIPDSVLEPVSGGDGT